jgi:hypothetical protein
MRASRVSARVFTPLIRHAAAALWIAGAAIAGVTAPLAATHESTASGLVFATVAIALLMLAIATARARRWALVMTMVLLGAQAFGALGSGWELLHTDDDKAQELRSLGIDPMFGIALNLVYSLLAFGLFVCALCTAGRRAPPPARGESRGNGAVPTPPASG